MELRDYTKIVIQYEPRNRISFRIMAPATEPLGLVVNMPTDEAADMIRRIKERVARMGKQEVRDAWVWLNASEGW